VAALFGTGLGWPSTRYLCPSIKVKDHGSAPYKQMVKFLHVFLLFWNADGMISFSN
jgi:hypothetical protein